MAIWVAAAAVLSGCVSGPYTRAVEASRAAYADCLAAAGVAGCAAEGALLEADIAALSAASARRGAVVYQAPPVSAVGGASVSNEDLWYQAENDRLARERHQRDEADRRMQCQLGSAWAC